MITASARRKRNIGYALLGAKGGQVVVLSNGMAGTIHALWKLAVAARGFDGQEEAFAKRIISGCRDFDELCKPVDRAQSDKGKASILKRKQDPEFLAALAAVAARRGAR